MLTLDTLFKTLVIADDDTKEGYFLLDLESYNARLLGAVHNTYTFPAFCNRAFDTFELLCPTEFHARNGNGPNVAFSITQRSAHDILAAREILRGWFEEKHQDVNAGPLPYLYTSPTSDS